MHLRRGGLRPRDGEAEFQIVYHAHFARRFGEIKRIRRRGDERRRAEILHQHDLPFGISRRHGHDGRAQLFDAVMQAESPRKQAVAEGNLEDVLVRRPRHIENAGDAGGPHVQIVAGIAANDWLARGAARRVQADDLFHRHGEQAEGIVVPEIVFGRVGNLFDVLERLDMLGFQPDRIEPLPIHLHVVVSVSYDMFKPFQLQFAQLFPVYGFDLRTEHLFGTSDFEYSIYFNTFALHLQGDFRSCAEKL